MHLSTSSQSSISEESTVARIGPGVMDTRGPNWPQNSIRKYWDTGPTRHSSSPARTRWVFWIQLLLGSVLLVGQSTFSSTALAVGDGSTNFNLYVPPNNISGRDSSLIITNVSPVDTNVEIIDDDTDGDDDDSVTTTLSQGESYVVRLKDGSIDDDVDGKRDGDYFLIRSNHPVVVQMATKSNWQHDWASGDGGGRSTSFFIYAPASSGADNDANIFSYADNTLVSIMDITTTSTTETGKTSVDLSAPKLVLSQVIHEGEDLNVRSNQLGLDVLEPGHTYWVQANNPVTMQYGHLGQVTGGNQARDGAGFVPSANGSSSGSLYYFTIPHNPGREREKELRISCFDEATVEILGANSTDTSWTSISSTLVPAGHHLDMTGYSNTTFRDLDLYKITVNPPFHRCLVFEGNWMETGSFGTSDFASAVSASDGRNIGQVFQAYLGRPGKQENVAYPTGELTNDPAPVDGYASHLYIYATQDNTNVTVKDTDSGGAQFSHTFSIQRNQYYDVVVDKPTYINLIASGGRPYFDISSDAPIMVMNGNFNDNWMAFFHSISGYSPRAHIEVVDTTLGCSETTSVAVTCETFSSFPGGIVARSLYVPENVNVVSLPVGAVQVGSRIELPDVTMNEFETSVEVVDIVVDCGAELCQTQALEPLAFECISTVDSELRAHLSTVQLVLRGSAEPKIDSFFVSDIPDYLGLPPNPRIAVDFTVTTPTPTTIELERAINDPTPGASATLLQTFSVPAGTTTLLFEDTYDLHYESTRYYRIKSSAGACSTLVGPQAVQTSGGMSSGFDAGLESNGKLPHLLARRSILRRADPFAIEAKALSKIRGPGLLLSGIQSRSSDLAQYTPQLGPMGAAPLNVSPGDLPAFTNAEGVVALDYVDENGERVASILAVRTQGDTYEHGKALCDRAAGGQIDMIEQAVLPQGSLVRFASRNRKKSQGEYAVSFKAYETEAGFDIHSNWLREDYPEVASSQSVINFQTWSQKPGLALTLAEDVLELLGANAPLEALVPESYFGELSVLGSKFAGSVQKGEGSIRVQRTQILENGTEVVDEPIGRPDQWSSLSQIQSATVALLNADGATLDRVWVSDGAWAKMDDSMQGGGSMMGNAVFDCAVARAVKNDGSLALSGCAQVSGTIVNFGGVARHLGGAAENLDLTKYQSMSLFLESSRDVELCFHRNEDTALCRTVASSEGGEIAFNLKSLRDDSCTGGTLDSVNLISVLAHGDGELRLNTGAIEFSENTVQAPLPVKTCETEAFSQNGCACGVPGNKTSSPPPWGWLLGILVLSGWLRRWLPRSD